MIQTNNSANNLAQDTHSQHHHSVMLDEVLVGLDIKKDGCYVDATLGRGGHTQAILAQLNQAGKVIAFDKDKEAIDYVQSSLKDERLSCIHRPFSTISQTLQEQQLFGKIDGVLMDLGVSSPQLDNPDRGFSFMQDGPLDMRMDISQTMTAASFLATADADEIANVLYVYGDEKKSRLIAKTIKKFQQTQELTTTLQLAQIIQSVIPNYQGKKNRQKKHPATRTFQALRIFVNQELAQLEDTLSQLIDCLAVGGRLALMSFHSLEDRMVKQFIVKHSKPKALPKNLPVRFNEVVMPLKSLGKQVASEEEVKNNPRSRSAILRVALKNPSTQTQPSFL